MSGHMTLYAYENSSEMWLAEWLVSLEVADLRKNSSGDRKKIPASTSTHTFICRRASLQCVDCFWRVSSYFLLLMKAPGFTFCRPRSCVYLGSLTIAYVRNRHTLERDVGLPMSIAV
ncbi:hypothetical protein CLV89_11466 [Tritonibacter scottomollicae]|uniref:Uncharacterized protein n=1 Tax=Tritonibacter scottomollicae TaxID=483013 RepID=A0A2T1AAH5_TRISK|nr:hypothetical protein CLV89_11466 [Tritonibacter scottomollicae]